MSTATNPFEGRFTACCHTIYFWYDVEAGDLTEADTQYLTEQAEARARELIAEDCREGELCSIHPSDDEDETRGWWRIDWDAT